MTRRQLIAGLTASAAVIFVKAQGVTLHQALVAILYWFVLSVCAVGFFAAGISYEHNRRRAPRLERRHLRAVREHARPDEDVKTYTGLGRRGPGGPAPHRVEPGRAAGTGGRGADVMTERRARELQGTGRVPWKNGADVRPCT